MKKIFLFGFSNFFALKCIATKVYFVFLLNQPLKSQFRCLWTDLCRCFDSSKRKIRFEWADDSLGQLWPNRLKQKQEIKMHSSFILNKALNMNIKQKILNMFYTKFLLSIQKNCGEFFKDFLGQQFDDLDFHKHRLTFWAYQKNS